MNSFKSSSANIKKQEEKGRGNTVKQLDCVCTTYAAYVTNNMSKCDTTGNQKDLIFLLDTTKWDLEHN